MGGPASLVDAPPNSRWYASSRPRAPRARVASGRSGHLRGCPGEPVAYSGQGELWMISTKSPRRKPGLKCSRTSAFTLPKVVSGLEARYAVALQEPARFVCAVDLEPPPVRAEPLAKAEIVEHRTDVEQLRIEAQATVAALQAPEPVHPARVIVDQLGGGVAYECGGLRSELGVRYGNARGERRAGVGVAVHAAWSREGHTASLEAGHALRRRFGGGLMLSLPADPRARVTVVGVAVLLLRQSMDVTEPRPKV
jgi:hypothetical protein